MREESLREESLREESLREVQAPPASQALLDRPEDCDLYHGGLVLDFGAPGSESRSTLGIASRPALPRVTHDGSTYARLGTRQKRQDFDFWTSAPILVSGISALARSSGARELTVLLDGKRLGSLRKLGERPSVVRFRPAGLTLSPGHHKVTLVLAGRANVEADVSWLRFDQAESAADDRPPSRAEVLSEMPVAGQQRRAIVLRSGSAFRCPLWIPSGTRLRTSVGIWGNGGGAFELSAIVAGDRQILGQRRIEEEDAKKGWLPIEVDLGRFGERAVDLELRALSVESGARLGFSAPELVLPTWSEPPLRAARRAVVLVLSGLDHTIAPGRATEQGLPSLAAFGQNATHYPGYRAPTTSPLGVMATLLSGAEPYRHGLSRDTQRLATSQSTLAEALAAAGGEAGLFTGVPFSFEGFGLSRGFERYVSISPTEDRSASAPLDEAEAWLESHREHKSPLLCVVHLRGAHPPFDVDRETARGLPPKEYGGELDARRAAIQLAEIRARSPAARRRMPEEDWVRLASLRETALLAQDARISSFFSWLDKTFPDDDSLVIVMGDVAAGERPHIPYADDAPLSEEYLQTLLVVRHPGGARRGQTISGVVGAGDVHTTIRRAFGLSGSRTAGTRADSISPEAGSPEAIELGTEGVERLAARRLQVAYRDRAYAARLGRALLVGQDEKMPRLCDLGLDPNCTSDRSTSDPTLYWTMWLELQRRLRPDVDVNEAPPVRPEEKRLDRALSVWGVLR